MKNRTFRKIEVLMRSFAVDFKALANDKISTTSAVVVADSDFCFRSWLLGEYENVHLWALFNTGSWE